MRVGVRVAVGFFVGVRVGVRETVGFLVGVRVGVIDVDRVGVRVTLSVGTTPVGVRVGVRVAFLVAVGVGVRVGVRVAVPFLVGVAVIARVGVELGLSVAEGVAVLVGVAVAVAALRSSWKDVEVQGAFGAAASEPILNVTVSSALHPSLAGVSGSSPGMSRL